MFLHRSSINAILPENHSNPGTSERVWGLFRLICQGVPRGRRDRLEKPSHRDQQADLGRAEAVGFEVQRRIALVGRLSCADPLTTPVGARGGGSPIPSLRWGGRWLVFWGGGQRQWFAGNAELRKEKLICSKQPSLHKYQGVRLTGFYLLWIRAKKIKNARKDSLQRM